MFVWASGLYFVTLLRKYLCCITVKCFPPCCTHLNCYRWSNQRLIPGPPELWPLVSSHSPGCTRPHTHTHTHTLTPILSHTPWLHLNGTLSHTNLYCHSLNTALYYICWNTALYNFFCWIYPYPLNIESDSCWILLFKKIKNYSFIPVQKGFNLSTVLEG